MHVTVYTTPTCGYCRMVKQFLSQRGVPFQERDVSRDERAAREMVQRSGQQGVPVTIIDSEVVVGFDRGRLEQILTRRARPRPKLGAAVAGAESIARKKGVSLPAGAYVGSVKPGSPAERAGLREGDIILYLYGNHVRGSSDLQRALSSLPEDQPVQLIWWRNGREIEGQLVF